ncbi:MAG: hypothetical protein MUO77_14120, partial [Anaerolineales bacterium]|nr:hypothetical protein [Anaerolineales bacterium]
MNRDFFRNCLILGIIGIVFVGGIAGLWYFFYGGGNGTLPVVQLVQPNETVTLASGQGLIVIARGQFSLGIDQIDLYVDGELLDSVSANGKSQAEVSFPWFATKVGFHELRVVARDQFGRASMPASVFVAVVKGSDPQYGIEPDSVLVSENFIGAGGDNPQADGNPQPGLPGELPPAEGGNGEAPEPVNPEPVGDQFANCQNPGQVVDELPVVELNVAAVPANNERVSLQITGKADDNTGLTFLRVDVMASLIGQALHDSTTAACDGQAHCEINIGNVLVDPGRALVTLTAQDTNCQMTVSPVWQDQVGEAAVDAPPSVTI